MNPEAPPASTLGGEITSGIVGAGVALACLLPPILHLVTGPLGPLIGGFIAASRVRPGTRGKLVIAVAVATALSTLVGGALGLLVSVATKGELPDWLPLPARGSSVLVIAAVVWIYAAVLAGIGTVVNGSLSKDKPTG